MKKLFTLLVIFTFFVSALSMAQIQKKGEIKKDIQTEKVFRDDGIKSFVKYPDISGGPLNTNNISPSIFPNMSPNTVVQIGTGTTTTSYLPIYSYFGYTYSQQIYTQAQIATLGQITKIRFYLNSGVSTNSNNWTIYLGHTTKTTFSSTTDWIPSTTMTQVFSGIVTYPSAGNWLEVTLSTPFNYNNTNNLVVAVDENTAGYSSSANTWRSFTSGTNTGIYYYSDGTNPDPASPPTASSRTSTLAQCQLEMTTTTPSLSTSPSSLAFGYVASGGTSSTMTYSLSGTNLTTGPVVVTAPANFEVSLDGSTWSSSVNVYYTAPTLASTTIYAHFKPTSPNTSYSGNITNVGGGASTNVAVTGSSYLYSRYCTSNATSTADEDIGNVTLGSLNNTSTCGTTGGVGSILNEYSNYTTTVSAPDLYAGVSSSFSVTSITCGGNYGNAFKIFIDFNQDGDFADAGEEVYVSAASTTGAHTETGNISVPAGATLGNTMMRVVCVETTTPSSITACGTYSWGETEDYLINIIEAPSVIPPSITTTTPNTITFNSAKSGGNITSTGGEEPYERGVCWSTSTNPTTSDTKTDEGPGGIGSFESIITGLSASTTYHVRAYATNSAGTGYGSDLSFTTPCATISAPYFEPFTAQSMPSCWSISGPQNWLFTTTWPAYGAAGLTDHTGTSGSFAGVDGSGSVSLTGITLTSPLISISALTTPRLRFYLFNNNTSTVNVNDEQSLTVDVWDGSSWNNGMYIWAVGQNASGWQQISINLATLTISGPIQLRFTVAKGSGSPFYDDLIIDDIYIENAPTNPIFSITPSSKAYGNATVGGGTIDQTFTISNTGGGTLSINSSDITLSGTDPTEFQLLDVSTFNLTSGQSANIRVQFAPTSQGIKNANLHIVDNSAMSSHDISITGTGILNAPQSLVGGLNGAYKPSLSWQTPTQNEIKIDDGTVEQNMWVGSPSSTNQLFYNKLVSPHNGTIGQIGLYTYAGSAGIQFNSVMLCPDDGSGKPNIGSPFATFSNVGVGTSAAWVFLTLSTPQSVTAGQTFYIVTQWPAGSTTGPYIGTDNTLSNGRSYWTQDGGATWNGWTGNFLMRAYMGSYSDKMISGVAPVNSKLIPIKTTLQNEEKNQLIEAKNENKNLSVPAALIYGKNGERVLSSYTVRRGLSSGSYNQSFTGISALTYDDNSVTMGLTYYYVVEAVYTEGTSSYSNEVSITAANPNYGNIMLGTYDYKFSNNTANGNPGSNEKPVYEWYPTTDFTTITFSDDDDGFTQVNFPGQYFKFFNNDYSSVYVGTNGYLTFGAGSTDYSPAGALPQVGDPANMIAAAFMDLYNRTTYSPASKISYKIFTDKIVISYENIYQISAASGQNYISYQIILCTNTSSPTTNSVFVINYNDDMSYSPLNTNTIVTGASVGVNGPSGADGYNYRYAGVKGPMFSGITLSPNGANSLALGFADMNAPLPVNLSSFTFKITGRDVSLSWITEIENNNAGFDVERKTSEGQWAKVGYTAGKGSTNIPTNYSFEDKKLNSGNYYYRLKQIDNNGNFEYHNLTSMVEIELPKKFNLSQNYPNPFNPTTKIDFDLPFDSKVSIVLYDITGREVKTLVNDTRTAGFYTVQFNASDLSSGTYFYRIITKSAGADYVMTKKMVLIK